MIICRLPIDDFTYRFYFKLLQWSAGLSNVLGRDMVYKCI